MLFSIPCHADVIAERQHAFVTIFFVVVVVFSCFSMVVVVIVIVVVAIIDVEGEAA